MTETPNYNRVLIGGLPFRQYVTSTGKKGLAADGSALPYLVEELIARSAFQIAISDSSNTSMFVNSLSPILRKRVVVVQNEQAMRARDAFLAPVLQELGVKPSHGGFTLSSKGDERVHEALAALFFCTDELFLGILHRLQIDLNLEEFRKAARIVRGVARDPNARACVAVLEGILSCYTSAEVPGLIALPESRPEVVELFHRLANDAAYQQASEGAGGLGVPGQFKRSIELMRRGARRVLRQSAFKRFFNFGAKVVTTVTRIPVPESELLEAMFERGFLPPIVSLTDVTAEALKQWRRQSPRFMHPDPTVVAYAFNSSEEYDKST